MAQSKKALGRGLSALLGDDFETIDIKNDYQSKDFEIDLELIETNPFQPRTEFKDEELTELANSIKEHGVVQPVLVRRKGNKYQLVAGERRFQASKRAGKATIPAVVKDLDDKRMFEVAIIENVQRENLNPLEEAIAYKKLMDKYSYNQDRLAEIMGKSRSHISNTLRVLTLSDEIQGFIRDKKLSLGHAKVLAGYSGIEEVARLAIADGWSVRKLESKIEERLEMQERDDARNSSQSSEHQKNLHHKSSKSNKKKAVPKEEEYNRGALAEQYDEIASMLSEGLDLNVKIETAEFGGNITVNFYTMKQLDQIVQRLNVGNLNF